MCDVSNIATNVRRLSAVLALAFRQPNYFLKINRNTNAE